MDEQRLDTGGLALIDTTGDGTFDLQITPETHPQIFDSNGDGVITDEERVDRILEVDSAGNIAGGEFIQLIEDPNNGTVLPIPTQAGGFYIPGTDDIWISTTDSQGNAIPPESIASIIVHEGNHALNPIPPEQDPIVSSYETEFRAYWVDGSFDHLSGDDKAAAIKQFLLNSPLYGHIGEGYVNDPDIASQIDAITRPNGNLDNS